VSMNRKKRKKVERNIKWPIKIVVPMTPQGQARGRAFALRRFNKKYKKMRWTAGIHKDEDYATYEALIAGIMTGQMRAMGVDKPLSCPVLVTAVAVFEKPKSHLRARNPTTWNRTLHTSKPDADNVMKSVKDAGNGLLWNDDAQVVPFGPIKVYGAKSWDGGIIEPGCLAIKIRPVTYEFLQKRIERLIGPDPTR